MIEKQKQIIIRCFNMKSNALFDDIPESITIKKRRKKNDESGSLDSSAINSGSRNNIVDNNEDSLGKEKKKRRTGSNKTEHSSSGQKHKKARAADIKSASDTVKNASVISDDDKVPSAKNRKTRAGRKNKNEEIEDTDPVEFTQLACCKPGWYYIDVTDLDWLQEHLGPAYNIKK